MAALPPSNGSVSGPGAYSEMPSIQQPEPPDVKSADRRSTDASQVLNEPPPSARDTSVAEKHTARKMTSEMASRSEGPSISKSMTLKEGLASLVNLAKTAGKTAAALVQGRATPGQKEDYRNLLTLQAQHALNRDDNAVYEKMLNANEKFLNNPIRDLLNTPDGARINKKEAKRAFDSLDPNTQKAIKEQAHVAARDLQDPEKAGSKATNTFLFQNNLYIQANPHMKDTVKWVAGEEFDRADFSGSTKTEERGEAQVQQAASEHENVASPADAFRRNIENAEGNYNTSRYDLWNAGQTIDSFMNDADFLVGSEVDLKETQRILDQATNLQEQLKLTKSNYDKASNAFEKLGQEPSIHDELHKMPPLADFDKLMLQLDIVIKDAETHKEHLLENTVIDLDSFFNKEISEEERSDLINEYIPPEPATDLDSFYSNQNISDEERNDLINEFSLTQEMKTEDADSFLTKFENAANRSSDIDDLSGRYIDLIRKKNELQRETPNDQVKINLYNDMAGVIQKRLNDLGVG